jgi:hypothetical protein
VLPTDSQKQTVYAYAKEKGVGEIEDFGLALARHFVGDVERAIVVGDRLVGSGPREARAPGLLLSGPIAPGEGPFDVSVEHEDVGLVTALAAVGEGGVAVGGDRRVLLTAVSDGRVTAPIWETDVAFQPAFLHAEGDLIWAAGSGTGALDDYDWDAQHGGGFVALDSRDGRIVVDGVFDDALAWGNGGVALALVGGLLCGVGRRGEIHLFDARDGSHLGTRKPFAEHSLGIAHCAAAGDTLVVGFNRGGYRLWTLPIGTSRVRGS